MERCKQCPVTCIDRERKKVWQECDRVKKNCLICVHIDDGFCKEKCKTIHPCWGRDCDDFVGIFKKLEDLLQ